MPEVTFDKKSAWSVPLPLFVVTGMGRGFMFLV